MNPERWRRVRTIFDSLLSLSADLRPRALEEACGEDEDLRQLVGQMLEAHGASAPLLDRPAFRLGEPEPSIKNSEEDASLPPIIGPYRPLRLLGQGGMGRVFLAERADGAFERQVAVKLLHPGLATEMVSGRFRRERQILARLEHPNIAGLLDGGTTDDGQPFLVMEYVEGTPLDAYCQRYAPSLEARLKIFLKICSAVAAAHRNLVVHRDLKPGNILVTPKGEPKLLDFGIAKLLEPEGFPLTALPTEPGHAPLTPEFASPEQVLGEGVTTASDVYSLGAVLFCLLTGHGPHRRLTRDPWTWIDAVCNTPVRRPSTSIPEKTSSPAALDPGALEGDLDHIVLMALRREPERRYGSVERLAADIEAFLDQRPVEARGESWRYRGGKFLRRHKIAAGAAGAAFIGLAVFSAVLWIQQGRLVQERDLARSTVGLLQDLFKLQDPTRSQGETITAREILDRKARQLERPLEGSLSVRAALRSTMGTTYLHLGLLKEAEEQLRRSLELYRGGGERAERAEVLLLLAGVLQLQNRWPEAQALALEVLETCEGRKGREELAARSRLRLGKLQELQGEFEEAEKTLRRGLRDVGILDTATAQEALATGLDDLGTLLDLRGRSQEAVRTLEESVEVLRRLHGDLHPEVAFSLNNLALVERSLNPAEALRLLRRAEAISRRLYGDQDPQLAPTLGNLGLVLAELHRFEEAEVLYQQALKILGKGRELDPRTAAIRNNLAELRWEQGAFEEAEKLHREVLEQRRRQLGENHRETAVSLNNLGLLVLEKGDLEESGELLSRALEASDRSFGRHHPQTALVLNNLALLAKKRGDLVLAADRLGEAAQISAQVLGYQHAQVALIFYNQGKVRQKSGNLGGAEESYQRAVSIARSYVEDDPTDLGRYLLGLANLWTKNGNSAAAAPTAREALELLASITTVSDVWYLAGQRILARALVDLKEYREAEPVLVAVYQTLLAERGAQDPGTHKALEALVELYEVWRRLEKAAGLRSSLELGS